MTFKVGDRVVYNREYGTVVDVYVHDWLDTDLQELDIRLDHGTMVRVTSERVIHAGEQP